MKIYSSFVVSTGILLLGITVSFATEFWYQDEPINVAYIKDTYGSVYDKIRDDPDHEYVFFEDDLTRRGEDAKPVFVPADVVKNGDSITISYERLSQDNAKIRCQDNYWPSCEFAYQFRSVDSVSGIAGCWASVMKNIRFERFCMPLVLYIDGRPWLYSLVKSTLWAKTPLSGIAAGGLSDPSSTVMFPKGTATPSEFIEVMRQTFTAAPWSMQIGGLKSDAIDFITGWRRPPFPELSQIMIFEKSVVSFTVRYCQKGLVRDTSEECIEIEPRSFVLSSKVASTNDIYFSPATHAQNDAYLNRINETVKQVFDTVCHIHTLKFSISSGQASCS